MSHKIWLHVESWVTHHKGTQGSMQFYIWNGAECITPGYILNGTDGYTQKLYLKYKLKFQVSDAEHTMVAGWLPDGHPLIVCSEGDKR